MWAACTWSGAQTHLQQASTATLSRSTWTLGLVASRSKRFSRSILRMPLVHVTVTCELDPSCALPFDFSA